ncbi:MAG TPA: ester cyclase [Pseudomonadota bacterium]|nr:ester cyclase [Pseudomonadota bacterium]
MNPQAAQALIAPFYDALNTPAGKDVAALIAGVASPDWRSFGSGATSKGRQEFIQQVIGFGRLIPDLEWKIQEVLVDRESHRIIVRSEASGTPAGDFMGVPHSGRRFAIMTIDIHCVQDGKLVSAHHVEDWATALRQLRG